ncbi:protein phosphatase 4 regulatory subunit 1 [Pelomyxa schiedti]|nr:protein phosphatase 4 regulatory subunit 1 [Pelomyxa schiedti]
MSGGSSAGEFPVASKELSPEELELAKDDSMPLFEKTIKHLQSPASSHKLSAVRELCEAAVAGGSRKTLKELLPVILSGVLCTASNPNDSTATTCDVAVKQAAVEQMSDFSIYLLKSGVQPLADSVVDVIVPRMALLLTDESPQVREACTKTFSDIVNHLHQELLRFHVLPVILKLSSKADDETSRAQSLQIIDNTVIAFPKEICLHSFIPILQSLSEDPSYRVRKTVAMHLGNISIVLGPVGVVSTIAPIYLKLAKDPVWCVRKSCADSLTVTCNHLPLQSKSMLCEVLRFLTADSSRWVKISAYQHLGEVLALLPPAQISDDLIELYTRMATDSLKIGDSDVRLFCAYSLPGVLTNLGKGKWSVFKPTFDVLSQDLQWKVRKSLAHSLHEIAKIIGCELTVSDLLPVFSQYLKDLDSVKVGVIKNISNFLFSVPPQERAQFTDVIKEMCVGDNWRMKRLIVKQIGDIARLYNTPEGVLMVQTLLLQLINDRAAVVRVKACKMVGPVVASCMINDDSYPVRKGFYAKLIEFAQDNCFRIRQLYAMSCHSMIGVIPDDEFTTDLLPTLLRLHTDPVVNVRVIVASTLVQLKAIAGKTEISLDRALLKLRKDADKDVQFVANVKS